MITQESADRAYAQMRDFYPDEPLVFVTPPIGLDAGVWDFRFPCRWVQDAECPPSKFYLMRESDFERNRQLLRPLAIPRGI